MSWGALRLLAALFLALPAAGSARAAAPFTTAPVTATPILVIDVDGLGRHFDGEARAMGEYLAGLPGRYGYLGLSSCEPARLARKHCKDGDTRAAVRALQARGIPVARNDYPYSPFKDEEERFTETFLEKLKRLKWVERVAVCGVIARPLAGQAPFARAGISVIPVGARLVDRPGRIEDDYRRFVGAIESNTAEELFWEGVTAARLREGNEFTALAGNRESEAALFALVDGARTFIHVTNLALEDDPFGRRFSAALIRRAGEGIRVRLHLDRISIAPYGTDYGLTWLTDSLVRKLRRGGVEVVFHYLHEPARGAYPEIGLYARKHSKAIVADVEGPGGRELAVIGGGRVYGSFSYQDLPRGRARNFLESALGVGWGYNWELGYLVKGPVTREIHADFVRSYLWDGGTLTPEESDPRLLPRSPAREGGARLRWIRHDTYLDQNTLSSVLRLVTGGEGTGGEGLVVNSFEPDPRFLAAVLAAARAGRPITWIAGGIQQHAKAQLKWIPALVRAGVRVLLLPYQLQWKLYGDARYLAVGTHNVDTISLKSSEDLLLVERADPQAAGLERELARLATLSHDLQARFPRDTPPEEIAAFVKRNQSLPFQGGDPYGKREHPAFPSLFRVLSFLSAIPFN